MFRIMKLEPRIVLDGNVLVVNTPPYEVMKDPLPGNEIVIPIFEQVQGKTPPLSVTAGHTLVHDISQHIVDNDQDPIIYTIDSLGADWLKGTAFDGSFLKIPKATNSDAGNYEVHFSASDGHNDPVKFSLKLTVAANNPPHKVEQSPLPGPTNPLVIKAGNNDYDLSPYITDDEKDTLRYSLVTIKPLDTNAAADTTWFKDVVFEGTHLKINSTSIKADGYKNYAVNFMVKDDLNENVSFSLRVQIVPNMPPHENASMPLPTSDSPLSVKVGSAGVYDLSSHITDDEKDTLKYSFVSDDANPDWLNKCSSDEDSGKLTIPAPSASDINKPYQIHFTVSDSMNAPQNFSLSVKVAANTPPHENASTPLPTSDSPLKLFVGQASSYDLSPHITDNENNPVSYNVVPQAADTNSAWLSGAVFKGSSLIIPKAPSTAKDNLYNISFYVKDDFGSSELLSISLKILQNSPPGENPDNKLPGHDKQALEIVKSTSSATLDLKQYFKDDDNDTLLFQLSSIISPDGGATDWFKTASIKDGTLEIPPVSDTLAVGKHYMINFLMGDGVNIPQLYSIPLTVLNRAPNFSQDYSLQLSGGKAVISATDPDGDSLTYYISGTDSQAFTLKADTGELTLNNSADFKPHQEFTLNVTAKESKSGGLSSAETPVKVTINSPPQGNADKPSLLIWNPQEPFKHDLAKYYTDADKDNLIYTIKDVLAVVPFQLNPDWQITNGMLTADTSLVGQTSGDYIIRFEVNDTYGGVIQNVIEVRFKPENQNKAPIIKSDFFSNSHAVGMVSASDPDGDKVSYSIVPTSDPNEIFKINQDTGAIEVVKPELLTGKEISFTVKVSDNYLPVGASTEKVMTVNPVNYNSMLTAVKDTAEISENDLNFHISVLDNDTAPNGSTLKVVKVENITGSNSGATVDTGKGIATIEADNSIHYIPGSSFQSLSAGETGTDTFIYTVSDGKLTAKAPVLVVITGINTQPIVSGFGIVSNIQDTDNIAPFSSFVLSEPDVKTDTQTMTITQADNLANGHLISSGGFKEDGSGRYTMTGTADAIQSAVRNIVFAPAPSNVPFTITETNFQAKIEDHVIANFATISASSAIPVSEAYPAETVWSCRDMIVPFKGISYADTSSDILGLSIEYGLPIFRLQQFKINDFDFGLKDETENVYEQINRMLREARLLAEIEEVNHADRNAETWRIDIHPIQIR